MTRTLAWPISVLLALALAAPAQAVDIPFLTGRVVDNAEILKPDTRRRITERLRQHEQATSNQIAVLTLNTLNGESVEEYAVRVFEQWKLGHKGKDNGVLVLVVPQERRLRIEVGYGLEGALPDAIASRIIRNAMTPRFERGDFDGGIAEGIGAVVAQLEGDTEAIEQNGEQLAAGPSEFFPAPRMALHEKVLGGAFVLGTLGVFTILGIVTPGMGWLVYGFLIPFWAMFPIAIFGSRLTLYFLIAYLVLFPIAKMLVSRSAAYRRAKDDLKRKPGGFTGGDSGGSWSSGESSSLGSSDDGFSGGGGRSGGGGASGKW